MDDFLNLKCKKYNKLLQQIHLACIDFKRNTQFSTLVPRVSRDSDVRVRTRSDFLSIFFHKSKPLLMPYPRIWFPDLTLFDKGSEIDKVRQFLSPVPSVTRGSTSLVETFDETFSDFFFSVWSLHIGAFHEKCCHIFHSLPKASYFDRRRPWGRISVKKRGISQKLTPLAKSVYCEKKLVTSTHT